MQEQVLLSRRTFLSLLAIAGGGSMAGSWPMHRVFRRGAPQLSSHLMRSVLPSPMMSPAAT
jgi:hypothetical protein